MRDFSNGKDKSFITGYDKTKDGLLVHYANSENDYILPLNEHNIKAINLDMEKQFKEYDYIHSKEYRKFLINLNCLYLCIPIDMYMLYLGYTKLEESISYALYALAFSAITVAQCGKEAKEIRKVYKNVWSYIKCELFIQNKEAFGYDEFYNKKDNFVFEINLSNIDDYDYKELFNIVKAYKMEKEAKNRKLILNNKAKDLNNRAKEL